VIDAAILPLTTSLQKLPAATIPSDHIGTAAPTRGSETPAIALGLAESRATVPGIGGIVLEQKTDPSQWEQRFARRLEGVLRIDVYAEDEGDVSPLTNDAVQMLDEERLELRAAGYLHLGVVAWERAEIVTIGTGNRKRKVTRQTLTVDFVFERVDQELPGPGGIIQQLDVKLPLHEEEDFQIT
jgi:hypothetical protein